MKKDPSIIVIGGGTGTSTVLTSLKPHFQHLTAIVSVADSGGSTGRLRDEFGFLPVGDLRQSLAALAKEGSQSWIRKLLLYRFGKGKGLKGHNLGNLILTALQDMAGSTTTALEIASHIFRLKGNIYPATGENVQLVVQYENGKVLIGEDHLNNHGDKAEKIQSIHLSPPAKIYSKSAEAIESADLVIIGPGDYYASLAAALSVDGMKEVMVRAKGKIMYIVNLMTRFNQTHDMTAKDHLLGIEEMIGRKVDHVLINNGKIAKKMLEVYAREQEFPVQDDLANDSRKMLADVVATTPPKKQDGDLLERTLLRHDPKKLAHVIMEIL
jgi:uncharacterized cofD-like protein